MKVITVALLSWSTLSLAGGTIGGGSGSIADAMNIMSTVVKDLPKGYADQEEFDRAKVRLEVKGTESTSLTVDGETVKVRKIGKSIVDDKLSKEVLPNQ